MIKKIFTNYDYNHINFRFFSTFDFKTQFLNVEILKNPKQLPTLTDIYIHPRVSTEVNPFKLKFSNDFSINDIYFNDENIKINHFVYPPNKRNIYCELNNTNQISKSLRSSANHIINSLNKHKIPNANLIFNSDINDDEYIYKTVFNFVHSAVLSNYSFEKYMLKKSSKMKKLYVIAPEKHYDTIKRASKYAELLSHHTLLSRNIINEPGSVHTPEYIENICKELCEKYPNIKYKCIKGDKELIKNGFPLVSAVGRGSSYQSRVIIMNYQGKKSSDIDIVLIGKGITHDSGGLNLKDYNSMKEMNYDCSGAINVLSSFNALNTIKPDINTCVILPLCENSIGSRSFKPNDILRSASNHSIFVKNTDAEGRLLLADCLYHATHYKPNIIIDIATLTGAIQRSLGNNIAGIWSNDNNLLDIIIKSGDNIDENCWKMPIRDDHREDLKCNIADISNCSDNINGGACQAAAFLEYFIKPYNIKWAHIDIAGVSKFMKGSLKNTSTGFGTGLLIDSILRLNK